VCAVQRRRFPVGANPTRQSLQPEAIGAVMPPTPDISLHDANCRDGPMCGRLRVGKENLHFAALVGAAMCSAFLRGTHDRWP
jgi:hypothetical protein